MVTIEETVEALKKAIYNKKFSLQDEKVCQIQILTALSSLNVFREYYLDNHNIIDFYLNGVGIEVKIKGNKKTIYKQCKRYCESSNIKAFVLITGRSMGFPKEIEGKPCYVLNLGLAWL